MQGWVGPASWAGSWNSALRWPLVACAWLPGPPRHLWEIRSWLPPLQIDFLPYSLQSISHSFWVHLRGEKKSNFEPWT